MSKVSAAVQHELGTIIEKGVAFTRNIERTVVESAKDVANAIWDEFNGEVPEDDAKRIGKGIGGKVPARVSEWKTFALAVPFGLVEAIDNYDKRPKAPTLTRVRLFKLARAVKDAGDYTRVNATVSKFIAAENKGGKGGKGNPATLGMGLGVIRNAQTAKLANGKVMTKTNLNAFRRELKELCDKYGVKF